MSISQKKSTAPSAKLLKSQVRKIVELSQFYQKINQYSLREEAYAKVLESYISIKKKTQRLKK